MDMSGGTDVKEIWSTNIVYVIAKRQSLIEDDTKDPDMVRQGKVGVSDINAVDKGKTATEDLGMHQTRWLLFYQG